MTTLAALDLTGRPVLVAGGGPVATRRTHTLVDGGALVTVVAPEATDEIRTLATSGRVTLVVRTVEEADVEGVWLVQACTGDADVDGALARWADARRTFCVVASDAARGSARSVATAAVGDVVLGVVSEDGVDPRRSAAVRDVLAEHLRSGRIDLRSRREVAAGSAAPAAPGEPTAVRRHATLAPGSVALVGGGPGDVDLMTVRARTLLAQADVVVTDRLGPTAVLSELSDDVEVVHVGKSPGIHQVRQATINQVLVDHALAGRRVVRLKGGDPFLFGRGGEEVLACRAAGVPVEVVPGITSAVAAAEVAGIPVTHRGTSARVHVVNGHGTLTALDLAAMSAPDVTVVVLMGLAGLTRLVAEALDGGVAPTTPVAVVVQATFPGERVVRAPLVQISERCAAEGVGAPGVIVVGAVAREGFLEPGADGEAAPVPPSRKDLREAAGV